MRTFGISIAALALALGASPACADHGAAAGCRTIAVRLDGAEIDNSTMPATVRPHHPVGIVYTSARALVCVIAINAKTDRVEVQYDLQWTAIASSGGANILIAGLPPMTLNYRPVGALGVFGGLEFTPGDQIAADTNEILGPLGAFYITGSESGRAPYNLRWEKNILPQGSGRVGGTLVYYSSDDALAAFFTSIGAAASD